VSDPVDLVAANRRRLRVRRILLIASAPLLLAVLLFAGKVLSMYAFAHQAIAAYAAGDYSGTVQAARGQEPVNIFEPYKAPFNVGVGLADAGQLDAARLSFEQALSLATGLEQCAVRVNLAIVLERIGDAALADGDGAAATMAWQEALAVSQDAPPDCHSEQANEQSPDPQRDMGETLDEQQQGLKEKLDDSTAPDQGEEDPQDGPDGDQLDDIKDQLEQGAQDRDEHDAQQDGDDGGSGTDRPW
jgi:hypothetical protein